MKTTIEQKIIPAIVIGVSLILGALGTYTSLSSKARLLDEHHEAINAVANRLSISLVSPLWDLNDKGAEEFLISEMTSGEVVAIVVHDAKDATFAAKGRDAQGKVTNLSGPVSDKYELLSHDVTKDGEKISIIQLYTSNESVQHELRVLLSTTIGQVILIDLVTIAILVVLIRRVVTRQLVSVMERLKKISEGDGDLTVSLPEEGAREISLLAMSFNTFVAKTRVVIDQVKILNLELAAAAEQLSTSTRDISKSNDAVSDQSKTLATAAEEMSVTVEQVERDASSVRDVSDAAQKTASNGVRVITQSVNAMQDISNVVQRAVTSVQGLGDESMNIRIIVDVFEIIANQSFLLALIAAIVAARAGDLGRGFAVVADEVRKLALRTQESTQQIRQMIELFQQEANTAAHVLEQGREQAQRSGEEAAKAGASLDAITAAIKTISDMNIHTASAAEEQSVVSKEIDQNIANISHVGDETFRGATATTDLCRELAEQSTHLEKLVARVRV